MKIINAIAVAALRPIDRLTCTDVRALYRTTTSWQIYLLWEILRSGVTLVADKGVDKAVSQGLEQEKYPLLSGVKLPRSEYDWNRANDYFRVQIDTSRDLGDLNAEISYMNEVVWSYFKDTCGLVKAVSKFNHYSYVLYLL